MGYRHYTEDLKTDPERGLPKEFFELFWTFLASKLGTEKRSQTFVELPFFQKFCGHFSATYCQIWWPRPPNFWLPPVQILRPLLSKVAGKSATWPHCMRSLKVKMMKEN